MGIKMVEIVFSPTNSSNYTFATQGIFSTYPFFDTEKVTTVSLAIDQMLGTGMLLIIILAVTDDKNMNIQSSLVPLTIGLGLTAGSAINPARDFSPRLFTQLAGWKEPFEAAN